jgi:hypothetical protein
MEEAPLNPFLPATFDRRPDVNRVEELPAWLLNLSSGWIVI